MSARSNTFFHFTKDLNTLTKIISDGFWPKYCLEDISWQKFNGYDFFAFPMVCFCDIPITRIDEHVNFYGKYGIGMSREWGEKNGLNPVFYISGNGPAYNAAHSIVRISKKIDDPDESKNASDIIGDFVAYVKPTRGLMYVSGKPQEKEFYQESEWRYLPKSEDIIPFMPESDFRNKDRLDQCHELTNNHCMLTFKPEDIRYIILEKDSEIPKMVDHIQNGTTKTSNEEKILISRFISLESIRHDF